MQNFMVPDEKKVQTSFGIFSGVETLSRYPQGELESVKLSEKNMIVTGIGELIPAYTQNERRKNKPSVEFSRNGMISSVALENQQEVITPIGELPVEFVTFYETGELHRAFVVDGQISGFWTEEDERNQNIPLTFEINSMAFTAMLNGICFYKSGNIKSITLFPGEKITVHTPIGNIVTDVGLALYESGALKSVEPENPVQIETPIGKVFAYDNNKIGIHADSNSLEFTEEGNIKSLITCDNMIHVQTADEQMIQISPKLRMHPLHDDQMMVEGIRIEFDDTGENVSIEGNVFALDECGFTIEVFRNPQAHCSPADCASCSLCNQ